MKILLGPAGTPAKSTLEGLHVVKDLGLQAMEVEFVHGIAMGNALAKQIGEENKKYGIKLSVHAPFYINLCSEEKEKIIASKKRILDSCERGQHMGAEFIVFHPGFYGKRTKSETYELIKNEIIEMNEIIKKNKWNVRLAPETTGRGSQFGDIDELVAMANDTKCSLCLDASHIFARNNGKINYDEVMDKIKGIRQDHLHCHFSGIAYGPKGERNHLLLGHGPDFKEFASALLTKKMSATIICESPITWKDSLKMKQIFTKLGYKF
jgi:deoxyribonuclease IV